MFIGILNILSLLKCLFEIKSIFVRHSEVRKHISKGQLGIMHPSTPEFSYKWLIKIFITLTTLIRLQVTESF